MQVAAQSHLNAMYRVMKYVRGTKHQGLIFWPDKAWDRKSDFEFTIKGISNSNYGKDPETRKSISGTSVFLNSSPITMKSHQQNTMTLSSTEAKLQGVTQCTQDMLYSMRVLESMRLKVKKRMMTRWTIKVQLTLPTIKELVVECIMLMLGNIFYES